MKSLVSIAFFLSFLSPALEAEVSTVKEEFSSIQETLQSYEAKNPGRTLTIDEILSRLPTEFRSRFTLMYESQSLQGASPIDPRVIMFGNDARSIMAFNGNSELNGYSMLEFASVNPQSDQTEFRFIRFPMGDSGEGSVFI